MPRINPYSERRVIIRNEESVNTAKRKIKRKNLESASSDSCTMIIHRFTNQINKCEIKAFAIIFGYLPIRKELERSF